METLYQKMRDTALIKGGNTAVVFFGKRIKFSENLELIDRAAAGLKRLGVGKGSVVTLCVPNTPSAQIAFYAINRLGAIVNLVHPYSPPEQTAASVKKTGSKLLIAYDLYLGRHLGYNFGEGVKVLATKTDYFIPLRIKVFFRILNRKHLKHKGGSFEDLYNSERLTEEPVTYKEGEPAVFLPSGGTLGTPKTIMHTGDVFNKLCEDAQFFLNDDLKNYEAMYTVLPIFHGFGLCMNMHMCALVGVKNVMCAKFNPKAMAKAIKKERINVLTGVPVMYSKLLANKKFMKTDLSTVKDCFVGGDSAPVKLIEEFNAALKAGGSGARLYQGYGLTEAISVCTVGTHNFDRPDSVGVPVPGAKAKIIKDGAELSDGEVGEICLSTPYMMLGYYEDAHGFSGDNQNPENPIKVIDGERWLFTGDLGYMKDGFVYFKQRQKNVLKVNGVLVFPSEIESVVGELEGISACAAIGITCEESGEAVKLFVEFKDADDLALCAELETKIKVVCKQKLLRYAMPVAIEFRKTLPRTAIGKVERKEL